MDGQIGLEPTIDEYVAKMVEVFGAVRRVLRDDGTLWVNLGDSYNAGRDGGWAGGKAGVSKPENAASRSGANEPGLKPLDLCNVPHRVASALQADGWYWRSTIIWAKGLSFCDEYAGSVMPESVNGWRWERCRVKVKGQTDREGDDKCADGWGVRCNDGNHQAGWSDCPGCPKCEPNGGYVLRKGSWRPTSAYEFVFMFAKTAGYFCDGDAVRETQVYDGQFVQRQTFDGKHTKGSIGQDAFKVTPEGGRNLRNVWVINPQPFPDAHFATFPEKLVEPIIKAATSDKGVCPECGGPWARVIDSERVATRPTDTPYKDTCDDANKDHGRHIRESTTLGWRPTCTCRADTPCGAVTYKSVPATILDPFVGSGTSLLVARKLGRDSIGIELSPEYAAMAEARVANYAPLFTEPAG